MAEGTYKENDMVINKNLTFIGNGSRDNVIIDAENNGIHFIITSGATVLFKNISFINGKNTNGISGGSICILESLTTIDNCKFINNTAGLNGGAIDSEGSNYYHESKLNLIDSVFIGNYAPHDGGAVTSYYSVTIIKNCQFYNNSANRDGGAVRVKFCRYHLIDNCTFMYNDAVGWNGWGGAIYTWSDVESYITNSYIVNNRASEAGGGITSASRLTVTNCTIVNNTAGQMGGGIYIYEEGEGVYTTINATNNNIYENTVLTPNFQGMGGHDVYISSVLTTDYVIDFNDNYWGINNPINASDYMYPWTERFETNNKTDNPTTWINIANQSCLIGKDIFLFYKNGTKYSVKLVDVTDVGLFNQPIIFIINGVNYTRKTNSQGIAQLNINLLPGIYNITAIYRGNDDYLNSSTNNTVTVLSTIVGQNIVKYYRNGTQFDLTILDNQGHVAFNKTTSLNINGVTYNRITDANGKASLVINLLPGDYIVTVLNSEDGLLRSFDIKVLSTLQGNNLVKYFRNGSQYSVKVLDKQGNIFANQNVTFNINGVFYTRTSNDLGIASLVINLLPRDYIVTAIHGDFCYSNTIKVLSTIESENLVMSNKNRVPFVVKVLDGTGKPLAGGKVSFNINGIIQEKSSSSDGSASLNIDLVAGKYIITTMFNGLCQSNTITIF